LGGHVQLAIGSIQKDFAEVGGAAFRGNRPHHIGEVFGPVCGGWLKLAEFHFDFDVALFALDLGFTVGLRQERRAAKIDFGGAAAIVVADRLGGPLDYRDTVDGQ
jgi:hypothetical protein